MCYMNTKKDADKETRWQAICCLFSSYGIRGFLSLLRWQSNWQTGKKFKCSNVWQRLIIGNRNWNVMKRETKEWRNETGLKEGGPSLSISHPILPFPSEVRWFPRCHEHKREEGEGNGSPGRRRPSGGDDGARGAETTRLACGWACCNQAPCRTGLGWELITCDKKASKNSFLLYFRIITFFRTKSTR